MTSRFQDHFSPVAADYADSRPSYPPALFEWLAGRCAARDLAWDCGAGSGQASIALAAHFAKVVATDASAGQIAQATPHPHVEYRVASAERSGLDDACADLITVAQALHWFDLRAFYAEVRRVAKPGALLAAWTYGALHVEDDEADSIVAGFRREIAPWWPAERRHVENGYRDLAFPFDRIDAPSFAIEVRWSLERLLGYFRSWSSVVRFREAQGFDPVERLAQHLSRVWGAGELRGVRWPIAMHVGRVAGQGPGECCRAGGAGAN